jgi:hypothetical protein
MNGPEYKGKMKTVVRFKDGREEEYPELGPQVEKNNNLFYIIDVESGKMHSEARLSDVHDVRIVFED